MHGPASPVDVARARFAPGFTLLELLVVLALVGLVASLALPNLERLRGAVASKTERDHILDQFAGLGRQAMLQRRAYVVHGSVRAHDGALPGTTGSATRRPAARPPGDGSGPSSHRDYERHAIDLPDGWAFGLDEPLLIYANGLCRGAGLTLFHRGAADVRVELEPPYCRVAPDA